MAKTNPILPVAQAYRKAREERLAADKVAATLKEAEDELKHRIITMMAASNVRAVGDVKNVFALVTKVEPTIEDWGVFYAYVRTTGDFDLLFRRVNPAAVKERWENHVRVPGVVGFPVDTLSVTKAKGT